ncbi:hypothetical protein BJD16_09740 [Aeromonas sobria]|uniref:Uncharacterized protein n=1 Tax=Aeromonas sobria TaxID=646 RepID=A0A1S2D2V1_AERSO|nr:hypothetical protein BJD16_09740 [Aeromonas sobria]
MNEKWRDRGDGGCGGKGIPSLPVCSGNTLCRPDPPWQPLAAPIHRGSRWPPRSTVAAAGRPDPPWQPLAAPIHRGSRWPPGSLLIPAVVMTKHEAAMQIARRLNELAMVGVFFIVLAPLMHISLQHHQGLP